jgi:hypothetical protein
MLDTGYWMLDKRKSDRFFIEQPVSARSAYRASTGKSGQSPIQKE